MTFPTATISTDNLDSATDDPSAARVDLLDAVEKLNTIIDEADGADGVAILNGSGLIKNEQIPDTISTVGTLTLAPTSGVVNIQDVLRLTMYSKEIILSFDANVAGDMIMCSNVGAVDTPGIAFFDGTDWKGLPFNANVFVTLS